MDSPGIYSLTKNDGASDLAIAGATAAAGTTCDVIDGLEGMTAVTLWARLAYGSGGTTVRVYVQTSLDGGTTWVDIACFLFATANESNIVNLTGLQAKDSSVVPTDGSLADDTVVQGVLGDRLRVKVISTGTYAASTTLTVRAAVR